MKSSATVFLAAFIALSASWAGFVFVPQVQVGAANQIKIAPTDYLYPVARPGLARQGAEVYRSLGCAYCHSQQVGQEGMHTEILLTDAGTNTATTLAALGQLNTTLAKDEALVGLPKPLMSVPDLNAADPILKSISAAGAKASVQVYATGPDISRGWGKRRTVAQDYLYDQPVQLGVRRAGPDLANIGLRRPDVNWHLRHLYAPRSEVKDSTMPPYPFLFERRPIANHSEALKLNGEFAPPPGYEVFPTEQARALAAYLVSLRADAPLFEAPFTPPPAPPATPTNATPLAALPYSTDELTALPELAK